VQWPKKYLLFGVLKWNQSHKRTHCLIVTCLRSLLSMTSCSINGTFSNLPVSHTNNWKLLLIHSLASSFIFSVHLTCMLIFFFPRINLEFFRLRSWLWILIICRICHCPPFFTMLILAAHYFLCVGYFSIHEGLTPHNCLHDCKLIW